MTADLEARADTLSNALIEFSNMGYISPRTFDGVRAALDRTLSDLEEAQSVERARMGMAA